MSLAYSLDDIARTSDDAAVRTRFDAATLTALRVFAVFALIAALPHFLEPTAAFRMALGFTSFLLALLTLLALRKKATHRLAMFIREHARGVAMVFALAQAALFAFFHASAGT